MANEDREKGQTVAGCPVDESECPAVTALRGRKFYGCGGCVWTVVGIFLLLMLVALLQPAPCVSHEAARRVQCNNNLKNIMVAMKSYSTKYGCYPPAYTVDEKGQRMHSWRVLLLEFMDRKLYDQYDLSRPWNSPGNLAIVEKLGGKESCRLYHCPTEMEDPQSSANTSYVMLVGPKAFSAGPTGRKPTEITDDPGNTLAVVEMSPSGILWTAPYDLNVAEMSFKINDPGAAGIRSCHSNGASVAFCDGAVRFCCNGSQDFEKYLKALATVNGGEDMSGFSLE